MPTTNNSSTENDNTDPPRVWIHLPFIRKRGTILIRSCTTKISRFLKDHAKFITLWDTTNTSAFLTLKDRTPKELQNSVVCKFTCFGCQCSYIGKTDRYLITRIKEQAYKKDSEIYNRINFCEHFYLQTLLNLPSNLLSLNKATTVKPPLSGHPRGMAMWPLNRDGR